MHVFINTVKRLDRSVPNFAHSSTLAQRFFKTILFVFFYGEGRGEEGLLNLFHFQKTLKPGRSRVIQASMRYSFSDQK